MKRIVVLVLLLQTAFAGSASAQDRYPARPVQMIVPFAAGTATDFLARTLAEKLSQKLGQPFVVQNRTGASGIVATELVAKALPDGYTILVVNSLHSINPPLHANLPYDTLRDFAGIAKFAEAPSVFVVHPGLGVRTVKEFIAFAKRQPGKIHYGTSGVGTNTHLGGAYFAARAGIELVAVPYKGQEIMADIIAGRIEALFAPAPALLQLIKDGKLIGLAVTSREPLRTPIELATVESAGEMAGFEYGTYYGLVAPAKVPRLVLEQLSRVAIQSVQEKDIRDKMEAQVIFPRDIGPVEFDAFIRSDLERVSALLKSLGAQTN